MGEQGSSSQRVPVSLRVQAAREVRNELAKPILNMAKFYIGDVIPAVEDATAVNERIRELKQRGVVVSLSEEGLLTKILIRVYKLTGSGDDPVLLDALRLLAGLVLRIVEDDDFYVPETTEHTSNEKVEKLAIRLHKAHQRRCKRIAGAVEEHGLAIAHSRDADALRARPGTSAELQRVLTKLRVHLAQGEAILEAQSDFARASKHRARLAEAYQRATNLVARLLLLPEADDHARLRRFVIRREHKQIEIDALGAERISAAAQARTAKELLAQTTDQLGEEVTAENKAALAAKLAELQAEAADDEPAEDEDEGDAGWFFDME